MDLSNQNDIQMTYLSFSPQKSGLVFSVDGKEYPCSDLEKSIHSIVNFVSTVFFNPIVAKIEILDKDEYFTLSLNLPIMPAFMDVKDENDISLLTSENYPQIAKQRARALTISQTKTLIDDRTRQYMNYILHEFAGAYIKCRTSDQGDQAKRIQKLPFMSPFDLSTFKFSNSGRNIYETPQFLRCNTTTDGVTQSRDYYMGLQENVTRDKKDAEFWKKVSERDREYLILDESMNYTIELLKQKYGEIEFLSPTASSNIEELPAKQ